MPEQIHNILRPLWNHVESRPHGDKSAFDLQALPILKSADESCRQDRNILYGWQGRGSENRSFVDLLHEVVYDKVLLPDTSRAEAVPVFLSLLKPTLGADHVELDFGMRLDVLSILNHLQLIVSLPDGSHEISESGKQAGLTQDSIKHLPLTVQDFISVFSGSDSDYSNRLGDKAAMFLALWATDFCSTVRDGVSKVGTGVSDRFRKALGSAVSTYS